MKLIFAESVYAKLVTELRANPDAVGVELTHAELVAVYDEVLSSLVFSTKGSMLASPVASKMHISGTMHCSSSDVALDTAGSSPDHMTWRSALSAVLVNVPPVTQVTLVKSAVALAESCATGVTAVPADSALILRSNMEVSTPVTAEVWLFSTQTR